MQDQTYIFCWRMIRYARATNKYIEHTFIGLKEYFGCYMSKSRGAVPNDLH
jgi:hypothetical protein